MESVRRGTVRARPNGSKCSLTTLLYPPGRAGVFGCASRLRSFVPTDAMIGGAITKFFSPDSFLDLSGVLIGRICALTITEKSNCDHYAPDRVQCAVPALVFAKRRGLSGRLGRPRREFTAARCRSR